MLNKIINKILPSKNQDNISKFIQEYKNISKKYNLDFIAVLTIFKDNKELSGEEELKEIENLNKILKEQKIGILPQIKIIKNDSK